MLATSAAPAAHFAHTDLIGATMIILLPKKLMLGAIAGAENLPRLQRDRRHCSQD
jgi:hypothetical protein